MFIYFWDRERHSMNRGGSEREGDTDSETGSRLWVVSPEPDAGLELTDCKITTWAEVRCLTDWATQEPREAFSFCASPFQEAHVLSFMLVIGGYRHVQPAQSSYSILNILIELSSSWSSFMFYNLKTNETKGSWNLFHSSCPLILHTHHSFLWFRWCLVVINAASFQGILWTEAIK